MCIPSKNIYQLPESLRIESLRIESLKIFLENSIFKLSYLIPIQEHVTLHMALLCEHFCPSTWRSLGLLRSKHRIRKKKLFFKIKYFPKYKGSLNNKFGDFLEIGWCYVTS